MRPAPQANGGVGPPEPGKIDEGWLRDRTEEAFRQKRAEEQAWPEVTDCDRLDQVFESLEGQGILALQNAGLTRSDGLEEVSEADDEVGGQRSGIQGYCFYHGQDLEWVMQSGELWLAFGHISGEDEPGVEIGRRIKRALEAAGFAVEWDGSSRTRLRVKGICWQRRAEEVGTSRVVRRRALDGASGRNPDARPVRVG